MNELTIFNEAYNAMRDIKRKRKNRFSVSQLKRELAQLWDVSESRAYAIAKLMESKERWHYVRSRNSRFTTKRDYALQIARYIKFLEFPRESARAIAGALGVANEQLSRMFNEYLDFEYRSIQPAPTDSLDSMEGIEQF